MRQMNPIFWAHTREMLTFINKENNEIGHFC